MALGDFGLPGTHTLKQTDFRSTRGGQSERWEYNELDENGQLVGRVSRKMTSDFFGKAESDGWVRYDLQGNVLGSGGDPL